MSLGSLITVLSNEIKGSDISLFFSFSNKKMSVFQFIITSSLQLQSLEYDEYQYDTSKNSFSLYLPLPEKNLKKRKILFSKKNQGNNLLTIWGKFSGSIDHVVPFSEEISIEISSEKDEYLLSDCSD